MWPHSPFFWPSIVGQEEVITKLLKQETHVVEGDRENGGVLK